MRRALCCGLLACHVAAPAATINVSVADARGQAVPDAAVYAVPRAPLPVRRTRKDAAIEQVNRQFVPLVTVVQTGTPVRFPNRDDVRHHVYSFSPAKPFEIKLYVGTPAEPVLFDKPGEVVLGCNIHDHMRAFVYVADTPFFAKTDAEGKAILDALPAGEFNVQVWHYSQSAPPAAKRVRLGADETAAVAIGIALRPRAAPASRK